MTQKHNRAWLTCQRHADREPETCHIHTLWKRMGNTPTDAHKLTLRGKRMGNQLNIPGEWVAGRIPKIRQIKCITSTKTWSKQKCTIFVCLTLWFPSYTGVKVINQTRFVVVVDVWKVKPNDSPWLTAHPWVLFRHNGYVLHCSPKD